MCSSREFRYVCACTAACTRIRGCVLWYAKFYTNNMDTCISAQLCIIPLGVCTFRNHDEPINVLSFTLDTFQQLCKACA